MPKKAVPEEKIPVAVPKKPAPPPAKGIYLSLGAILSSQKKKKWVMGSLPPTPIYNSAFFSSSSSSKNRFHFLIGNIQIAFGYNSESYGYKTPSISVELVRPLNCDCLILTTNLPDIPLKAPLYS